MTTKLFGTRVQRVEDQRFLRGHGRYVDDVAVGPATLHAVDIAMPPGVPQTPLPEPIPAVPGLIEPTY